MIVRTRLNVPMAPGSGDAEWVEALRDVVLSRGEEFAPELVLVSAGFDAHADDPLAGCEVSDSGFVAMAALVRGLADRLEVPLGFVLEGGYDVAALARCVTAVMAEVGAAA